MGNTIYVDYIGFGLRDHTITTKNGKIQDLVTLVTKGSLNTLKREPSGKIVVERERLSVISGIKKHILASISKL